MTSSIRMKVCVKVCVKPACRSCLQHVCNVMLPGGAAGSAMHVMTHGAPRHRAPGVMITARHGLPKGTQSVGSIEQQHAVLQSMCDTKAFHDTPGGTNLHASFDLITSIRHDVRARAHLIGSTN